MPDYGNYAERRVYPRYSVHLTGECEALFRRAPGAASDSPTGGGNPRYPLSVVNISLGGAMLTFDADFDANDTLRLHFMHPVTGRELSFEGHLVYVRKNATKLLGKYCAGMSFKQMMEKDPDLAELIEYAATLGPPNLDLK